MRVAHVVGCIQPMEQPISSLRTHADLLASGFESPEIFAMVRQGKVARIRRGVYGPVEELDPDQTHLRLLEATFRLLGPDAVVSHQSAGVLHGLPVPWSELKQVTVSRPNRRGGYSGEHVRVYGNRLLPEEITHLQGYAATTRVRTAVDLARTLHDPWGLAVFDAALRQGLTREELEAATSLHPGLKGLPKARMLLGMAEAGAESPAESYSRWLMVRAGLPTPELQFVVRDADGNWVARTDFGWEHLKLVGEVDGMDKYGRLLKPGQTAPQAVRNEKRREDAIRDCGYDFVRWDLGLAREPRAFVARLQRAFERQLRRLG